MKILEALIDHDLFGLINIKKTSASIVLSYCGKNQTLEWNLPEDLISIYFEDTILTFKFFIDENSFIIKKLYHNNDSFYFKIPDGIVYYTTSTITSFPSLYYKSREGSSICFKTPTKDLNLTMDIYQTGKELVELDTQYFCILDVKHQNKIVTSKIYVNENITIDNYLIYLSPYSTRWPVFVVSDRKLTSNELVLLKP